MKKGNNEFSAILGMAVGVSNPLFKSYKTEYPYLRH